MSAENVIGPIVSSLTAPPLVPTESSRPEAVARFREIVRLAARDPIAAGHIARDESLDSSLRGLAKALAGHPNRNPTLRAEVDRALRDARAARELAAFWQREAGADHFLTRLWEGLAG